MLRMCNYMTLLSAMHAMQKYKHLPKPELEKILLLLHDFSGFVLESFLRFNASNVLK